MRAKYEQVRLVTVRVITVLKIEVTEPAFWAAVSVAHLIVGLIWVKYHNFLFNIKIVHHTGKF
jgi:hypothetical protein